MYIETEKHREGTERQRLSAYADGLRNANPKEAADDEGRDDKR